MTAMTPKASYYGYTPGNRKTKFPKGIDRKFKACKKLNRLGRIDDKEYIKSLFDEPDKVKDSAGKYNRTYNGEIAGIEVRLYIDKRMTPRLYAENDVEVETACQGIRNRIENIEKE